MEEYVLDAVVASVELVVPGLGPLAGMLAGLAGDLAGAGAADREFLELWHEGEQPSTPWGTDRRRDPAKARNNATMAVLATRRRQRARREQASDASPPAAAQRGGKPRHERSRAGPPL